MKHEIAFIIQNVVQFDSVRVLIDELSKKNHVDIFIPKITNSDGYSEMYDHCFNFIKKEGYFPKRKANNKVYKILFEAYPDIMEISYQYKIKFKYSIISAKPFPVYEYKWNFGYDAILCHSTYEAKLLNVYSQTHIVGSLKHVSFRRKKAKNKPVLLYLPTYGQLNSIEKISSAIQDLKSTYHVIIKAHHGTQFLHNEKRNNSKLKKIADEYHDSSQPLSELLQKTDVVVSDNSGSIFDALYLSVPVVVFSESMSNMFYGIESLQQQLINNGTLPYTDDPMKLKNVIKLGMSGIIREKQRAFKSEYFPISHKNALKSYLNVVERYLDDNLFEDEFKLRRYFIQEVKLKEHVVLVKNNQEEYSNHENHSVELSRTSTKRKLKDLMNLMVIHLRKIKKIFV